MPALYHRNVAGGPAVKGVECRKCGQMVGLLKSKSGKWYTCQLVASMNPDSQARNAYPFLPHYKHCRTDAEMAARAAAREAESSARAASADAYADAVLAAVDAGASVADAKAKFAHLKPA